MKVTQTRLVDAATLTAAELARTTPRVAGAKLGEIAEKLQSLSREVQLISDLNQEGSLPLNNQSTSMIDRAMQIYRDRRRREVVFGDNGLFGEPAWDIMLDLFVASQQNKRIAVTSACIGSAVPATTALRWIKILEDRGLIERETDEGDARRTFVRLSSKGIEAMKEFLEG